MQTSIFIGRFQPIHKGHVQALRELAKSSGKIMIIIGTPLNKGMTTLRNPLTTSERKELLNVVLNDFPVPVAIKTQRDIGIVSVWRDEILMKIPKDAIVVSGNKNLLKILGPYRRVRGLSKKIKVRATLIRSWIKKGDIRWKKFVPKGCVNLLLGFGIVERLRR